MSTVIAIDHGNSAVKTVSHQFVSGLSDHLARPPLAVVLAVGLPPEHYGHVERTL